MTLDPDLLAVLVCPVDQGDLSEVDQDREHRLVCGTCGRRYPVREGIPIMLVEEADRS
ncbi:MAG TPA: Trm112 family protein [Acidimicrobiia bacterium]